MPVALISTITSPARGPSSLTVVTSSGLPAATATAAFTSIPILRTARDSLIQPWRRKRNARAGYIRLGFGFTAFRAKKRRIALVAQVDRASDFESEGREFESLRARQIANKISPLWVGGSGR